MNKYALEYVVVFYKYNRTNKGYKDAIKTCIFECDSEFDALIELGQRFSQHQYVKCLSITEIKEEDK